MVALAVALPHSLNDAALFSHGFNGTQWLPQFNMTMPTPSDALAAAEGAASAVGNGLMSAAASLAANAGEVGREMLLNITSQIIGTGFVGVFLLKYKDNIKEFLSNAVNTVGSCVPEDWIDEERWIDTIEDAVGIDTEDEGEHGGEADEQTPLLARGRTTGWGSRAAAGHSGIGRKGEGLKKGAGGKATTTKRKKTRAQGAGSKNISQGSTKVTVQKAGGKAGGRREAKAEVHWNGNVGSKTGKAEHGGSAAAAEDGAESQLGGLVASIVAGGAGAGAVEHAEGLEVNGAGRRVVVPARRLRRANVGRARSARKATAALKAGRQWEGQ